MRTSISLQSTNAMMDMANLSLNSRDGKDRYVVGSALKQKKVPTPMGIKTEARHLFLALCCMLVCVGHAQESTGFIEAKPMGELSAFMEDFDLKLDQAPTGITPVTLEGVDIPPYQELNGKILSRNGHGLRSFTFYGLSMKMYVASFYSEIPFRNAEDVLDCTGCPMLFHFTFLRSVGKGQVKLAWKKQLDWSVSHTYDGFLKDRDDFINMFSAMVERGCVTVKFLGEDTLVLDQGKLKGFIRGENFQRAFLSMWFGEKAVADDLKVALLGNSSQAMARG